MLLVLLLFTNNNNENKNNKRIWSTNIEQDTINNDNWRNVVATSDNMQVALMSVPPGEELGAETHPQNDQFFRIERGNGKLVTDIGTALLSDGSTAIVPRGVKHNLINTGAAPLKLYTLYSPPHHKPHTWDRTHADEIARKG